MIEGDSARLHAIVEGYVQGVGFRYFVNEIASSLGLTGWVRNRWDGSVEVLAEGQRSQLNKLLYALHQGPRSADVSDVTVDWEDALGEFDDFRIKISSK
jgi:acylphosphatase